MHPNLRPPTQKLAAPPPPGDSTPKLPDVAAALLGGRVHVDITVPRTDVRGRMRLLSRVEVVRLKADMWSYFEQLRLPCDPLAMIAAGYMNELNAETAVRHLAIAVRDPADLAHELAPLEAWRECADDQIAELWQRYQDLADQLDPIGAGVPLTDDEFKAIEVAVKKKDAALLMPFGSRRLALYITTSGEAPAS